MNLVSCTYALGVPRRNSKMTRIILVRPSPPLLSLLILQFLSHYIHLGVIHFLKHGKSLACGGFRAVVAKIFGFQDNTIPSWALKPKHRGYAAKSLFHHLAELESLLVCVLAWQVAYFFRETHLEACDV